MIMIIVNFRILLVLYGVHYTKQEYTEQFWNYKSLNTYIILYHYFIKITVVIEINFIDIVIINFIANTSTC